MLGIAVFMLCSLLFFPKPPEDSFLDFKNPTQRDLIANLLMIGFFYLNYFVLIPRIYYKNNYAFSIIAGFALITLLPSLLTGHFSPGPHTIRPLKNHNDGPAAKDGIYASSYFQTISHIIFLFLTVVLFSLLLRSRQRYYETETAWQQAELLSLKSQINPHFLFNTLNSIYSLALVKSEQTADAIVQLSKLMRYVLRDVHDSFISLDKELDYIENYITLQKTRLQDSVTINFSVIGNTSGLVIAPLILISFIENAFQYGVNPEEESAISIAINVVGKEFSLLVSNNMLNVLPQKDFSGIGIKNTRKRLQLVYPDRHTLLIEESNKVFRVRLNIHL